MQRRNTFQRSIVLETARKLKCHASADEIYEDVKKVCPAISRATVYRNLQQLCEIGEIQKIEIPGSPDRYDHITANHYHIRCSACGKVADADMDYIPDLQKKIKDTHGYIINAHSIVFKGICPECQAKEE